MFNIFANSNLANNKTILLQDILATEAFQELITKILFQIYEKAEQMYQQVILEYRQNFPSDHMLEDALIDIGRDWFRDHYDPNIVIGIVNDISYGQFSIEEEDVLDQYGEDVADYLEPIYETFVNEHIESEISKFNYEGIVKGDEYYFDKIEGYELYGDRVSGVMIIIYDRHSDMFLDYEFYSVEDAIRSIS